MSNVISYDTKCPSLVDLTVSNKWMKENVPNEVWDDLHYEVAKAQLEYDDTYRAYKYGDETGEWHFKVIAYYGCCGSFQSHTTVDGVKWIIGCNYGH